MIEGKKRRYILMMDGYKVEIERLEVVKDNEKKLDYEMGSVEEIEVGII